MAAENLCGVCKENPASVSCSNCNIPLCEICACEVTLEKTGPAYRHKGISTSTMKPAKTKKSFCPDCVEDVDLFD